MISGKLCVCNRPPVTKCLKMPFKMVSLLNCLLCVHTALVYLLSDIILILDCLRVSDKWLKRYKVQGLH